MRNETSHWAIGSGHRTSRNRPSERMAENSPPQPRNHLCYLRVTHVRPHFPSPPFASNSAAHQGHSTQSGYLS